VRFETPAGATRVAAMARIVGALRAWLARQGLAGVEIEEDPEPPRADPVSGKLREVLGLREPGRHESRPGEPARRRRGHHDPGPRESGPQAAPAPTRQRNRKPPAKGANTR
jgi:hypothetical protein